MTRILLLGSGIVILLVSLAGNYVQHKTIERQVADIATLQAQVATLMMARDADTVATTNAEKQKDAAARAAQGSRDALHEADKMDDDAAYLEQLGRLWRERSSCPRGGTPTTGTAQ